MCVTHFDNLNETPKQPTLLSGPPPRAAGDETEGLKRAILAALRRVRDEDDDAARHGGRVFVAMRNGMLVPEGHFRPYVEVVVDHAGFHQTVQNMYAVSQLLDQGLLLMHVTRARGMVLAAALREETRRRGGRRVRGGVCRDEAGHGRLAPDVRGRAAGQGAPGVQAEQWW